MAARTCAECIERLRSINRATSDPSARPLEVLALLERFELSGYELELISLERWTTWFGLRWAAYGGVLPDERRGHNFERIHTGPWHATDDRGATYHGIGAAGGGTLERWLGDAWLCPALDAHATSLSLRFRSPKSDRLERVAISLR